MGREAHILLAGLGLLAGAFVGVLSIKLLSPRPPAGAGADIHGSVAISTAAEIVEPPTLSIAAERAVAAPADRYSATASGFSAAAVDSLPSDGDGVALDPPLEHPLPTSDPFARTGRVTAAIAPIEEPQLLDSEAVAGAEPMQRFALDDTPAATAAAYVPAPTGHAPRHEVTRYVAAVGDSWWSLAERMYGDGRYYRALFAWNRAVNPRVSLVPGTPLELPPLSKLAVAWPALVPDE